MECLVQRIAEKAATNVEKDGTMKTKKLTIKTLQKCIKDKETILITVFMYIDLYSILEYLVDGAISSRSDNKGDDENDNYGSSGGGCGGIEGALWELVAVAHIVTNLGQFFVICFFCSYSISTLTISCDQRYYSPTGHGRR